MPCLIIERIRLLNAIANTQGRLKGWAVTAGQGMKMYILHAVHGFQLRHLFLFQGAVGGVKISVAIGTGNIFDASIQTIGHQSACGSEISQ